MPCAFTPSKVRTGITQTLVAFSRIFVPDHMVAGPFAQLVSFCPNDEIVLIWQSLTKAIIYELLYPARDYYRSVTIPLNVSDAAE